MSLLHGFVHRVIAIHLINKVGLVNKKIRNGAITLIRWFGLALNPYIHLPMLILDGVYAEHSDVSTRFRWVKQSGSTESTWLVRSIGQRVGRFWKRIGLLERDVENSHLAGMRWSKIS